MSEINSVPNLDERAKLIAGSDDEQLEFHRQQCLNRLRELFKDSDADFDEHLEWKAFIGSIEEEQRRRQIAAAYSAGR